MAKPKKWDTMTPEEQEAWRERKREKDRKYREANIEEIRERTRKYLNANPEYFREMNRKRYEANPEYFRKRSRKRYEANPENFRKKNRKYRKLIRQQSAADSFFQLQAAAQQISTALQTKPTT